MPQKKPGILFLFILLNTLIQAQRVLQEAEETSTPDTIVNLEYQLDSIALVTNTVDTIVEGEYTDQPNEEDSIEQEYFLQKEFTGGLPDTVKFRRLGDNMIKTFRDDKAFWYANASFKKKQSDNNGISFTVHPLFQTLIWLVIIGGFVSFLILYLKNSNAGLFRKSSNIADEETNEETSDIFSINYQKEIDRAVGISNYRLAVRLMFLRLLRDMSDKNLIQYKQDNTNFDYMIQLQATELYPDFFRLARSYEFSWYGQFEIDKEKFAFIRNEFNKFEHNIK